MTLREIFDAHPDWLDRPLQIQDIDGNVTNADSSFADRFYEESEFTNPVNPDEGLTEVLVFVEQ